MKTLITLLLLTLHLFANIPSTTDAQGSTSYEYDAIGRQTKVTYPNGITTNYSYDSRNRVTKIEHKKSDGTVLQSFAYTLDAVGNRVKVVENSGRTIDYTYNEVNQLTKEVVSNDPGGNNTTTTYSYDAVGNLISKTIDGKQTDYSYNANDQLTTQGSVTFTYDANGNLITQGDTTYEYDDKNRLIKVTTPNNTVEYSYDANDNRVAKIVNGDTTTYLIDANTPYAQVITESKADGTEVNYTYGNDLLSDGTHSFLTDALGSTRGLVDNNEQLTDSYAYTPYGKLANHTGSSENDFLFTGEQRDKQTGNYYLRARYYDPSVARFLSRDSYDGKITDPFSLNHYAYAGGNPVMFVDPSGHFFTMADISMAMNMMSYMSVRIAVMRLPTSGFIGAFLNLGRTVAIRIQYVRRVNKLAPLARQLRAQGKSAEEIAKIVHRKRRALGRLFKNVTDEKTRANIFARNLEKYGDKWGPTISYLRNMGRSWDDIIESASRPNSSLQELIRIFFKN